MMLFLLYNIASGQETVSNIFKVPCFDGWMECIIDEELQQSGLRTSKNMKQIYRSRINFLTLKSLKIETHGLNRFPENTPKKSDIPKFNLLFPKCPSGPN